MHLFWEEYMDRSKIKIRLQVNERPNNIYVEVY